MFLICDNDKHTVIRSQWFAKLKINMEPDFELYTTIYVHTISCIRKTYTHTHTHILKWCINLFSNLKLFYLLCKEYSGQTKSALKNTKNQKREESILSRLLHLFGLKPATTTIQKKQKKKNKRRKFG